MAGVHTNYRMYTDEELIRAAEQASNKTSLEVELLRRLDRAKDEVKGLEVYIALTTLH